jgi:hypothetical protein
MAIEIAVKYERLIRNHESRHRFLEVVDLREKLRGEAEMVEVAAWLRTQSAPFCRVTSSDNRCLSFRATPSSQRQTLLTRGLLESFLDVRTELELIRFAKRYGPLGQAVLKDPHVPKPQFLGPEHYEPVAAGLALAALFRIVRQQISWLNRSSLGLSEPSTLNIELISHPDGRDEYEFSRMIIPLELNDQHLKALGQHFDVELSDWWNQVQSIRPLWSKAKTRQLLSSYLETRFNEEINRSVFLNAESSHVEFGIDMFVRGVLNRLITNETQIEIGTGGFVFTNMSLLGVLANQLGALYRGRGSLGRVCIAPGCEEIIDPKRRSDAVYCPACKHKLGSKRQVAKRRLARERKS